MHGKEEWVLVQHSSQHKSVEWPVRIVFPDCLSLSCDYALRCRVGFRYEKKHFVKTVTSLVEDLVKNTSCSCIYFIIRKKNN